MVDTAEAPKETGRRRSGPLGLGWPLVISSLLCSAAIAVLVASWVAGRGERTITPEELLRNEGVARVDGRAAVGKPAPPTRFEYLDGGTGSLADFAGKPLLVNFWASTCPPCLREMPAIERLYQELGDRVAFLGVDVSEAREPGRAMVRRTGVTYPQARDPQGELIRAYGGVLLPHTVVIDARGVVVEARNKALDEAELRDMLSKVTGGR